MQHAGVKINMSSQYSKSVFVALNAKFAHTNPAVRGVAGICRERGLDVDIVERPVNSRYRSLLMELYEARGDVYIFSAYIWNIDAVEALAADLRKVLPASIFAVAGPQVSFHGGEYLRAHPAFDAVLDGEGECSTPEFLTRLAAGKSLSGCPGLIYREGDRVVENLPAEPFAMDDAAFVYTDLDQLSGRILYYESMRGCPFRCAYCLSQTAGKLRMRSLSLVCADMDRFLAANVRLVKFVDRTFNADKDRALAIWRYLKERDKGVTCFHFELAGELIDEETIHFLSGVRPGLFQFEIGVQSTNNQTLAAVNRPFDFEKLAKNITALQKSRNIHLHLDLIAGLPHEDFQSFSKSFDTVYALNPDQLQLGFLKILPGTEMEEKAAQYGIEYSGRAPFEVLSSDCLSFGALQTLHGVADMVELYHNSGRFTKIISYILSFYQSPFTFFRELWDAYRAEESEGKSLSKLDYYNILEPFMRAKGIPVSERAKWLCKYDVIKVEKPRKLPAWTDVEMGKRVYGQILDFFSSPDIIQNYLPSYAGEEPKRVRRIAHLELFPFAPDSGQNKATAALFDYRTGKVWFFPVNEDGTISHCGRG
jgi:radical SAM superfamily enzyme YgiQ (UPF0313 family)